MGKKYTDGEILKAMQMHYDYDSVVYGANGHYGIGGDYYVFPYYGTSHDVSGTTTAQNYVTDCGKMDENLQKAIWLKEL